jgi:hypothetical protein
MPVARRGPLARSVVEAGMAAARPSRVVKTVATLALRGIADSVSALRAALAVAMLRERVACGMAIIKYALSARPPGVRVTSAEGSQGFHPATRLATARNAITINAA